MTDELLLVLGCAIGFLALAGAYLAMRAGFAHGFSPARRERAARGAPGRTVRATADPTR